MEPVLARRLPRVEAIAIAVIAIGVVARVAAAFTMDVRSDGNTYAAMAHALVEHGRFLMPWGDVTTWSRLPPQPSHHYPPLYPAYVALFYKAFGFGLWQTKLASVVAALIVLPVVFFTTRDLFGRSTALLTTGLVAAEPHLVWVAGTGFSENLVLAFFALTMWGILKSLREPRFIVVAGLAAGLAYLTRASVGTFFVVAGMGGFLWRFAYVRWRVFTDRWYLAAIGVFGVIFLSWATRNFLLFGWATQTLPGGYAVRVPDWQTSSYVSFVLRYALDHPALWAEALSKKSLLFTAYLLAYAMPFLPEARRAYQRIRDEDESALWLSVFLVFVLAWLITSMFWVYEQTSIYWWDNHRYVAIAYLPLAWLLFRRAEPAHGGFRARYLVVIVALLAATAYVHAKPTQYAEARVAEALVPMLEPGDEIAVDGNTIKYAFYAYMTDPLSVTIYGYPDNRSESPDYIVSHKTWRAYAGYRLVDQYEVEYLNGDTMKAKLWVSKEKDTF